MPGAPLRRPARTDEATGLSALADLVNDALARLGARPAYATAGHPHRPAVAASVPTAHAERGRWRGTAARPVAGTRPGGGSSDDTGSGDDPGDAVAGGVEESHAEGWRLVRAAQDGDGEAFGVLYDRYVDVVYRFIYFRVNDRALAEDFTSETFLRALRRIGSFSYQGRDIGAWFVTIARNIVLDHMKSARHRLETPTGETIERKDHERSTEAAVLETLQSERLMAAVRQLGDEQRDCVMLRFIQGLSVSETAAVMGKNDGAVKALQHRAVRKLAEIVGGELR
ncbi:sigma-70 family RNA polymerase sigma factor [Jatrophihabitans endophyticus]|nr:sigma-70 family RNA polymerase sigma factor [Jatrophihabitans endophyticus]